MLEFKRPSQVSPNPPTAITHSRMAPNTTPSRVPIFRFCQVFIVLHLSNDCRVSLSLCLQSRLHHSAQKTGNVEDQTDPTVAKNRRPGDPRDASKRPAQRLHHRLHAAQQFVHCYSGVELIDLDDDDVLSLWGLAGETEHSPQSNVGKRASTQAKDPTSFWATLFRGQFRALGHMFQRNDKSLGTNPDGEPFNDG